MSAFEGLGRWLIIGGAIMIVVGLFFVFGQKLPFLGKLPGDILVQRGNFRFYFPLMTSILISLILTVVLNIMFRLLK